MGLGEEDKRNLRLLKHHSIVSDKYLGTVNNMEKNNESGKRKPQKPNKQKKENKPTLVQEPVNKSQQNDVNDLEVAKKMLKIYQSASDRNLEFNLTLESVRKLLSYPTCYYTNKKFEDDGPNSRSFDRVDSAKGYIEGNVVACTIDINGKKSNLSFEEIECIYKKIIAHKSGHNKVKVERESQIKESQITEIKIEYPEPNPGYIEGNETASQV